MRIQFITPNIAVGGAIGTEEAMEIVKRHGITHIINLDKRCDAELLFNSDKVEVLHYYLPDDGEIKPKRYWDVCVKFAKSVLKDPSNKLFIHCAAGANRSVSMFYAIMLNVRKRGTREKWRPEEIEQLVYDNYHVPLIKRDKNFISLDRLLKVGENFQAGKKRIIQYKKQIDMYYLEENL